MLDKWLLGLPDADIMSVISAVYDHDILGELALSRPDLLVAVYDSHLLAQAEHVALCDFDRVLAVISWNEEG